jgi:hypothetical protein
MPAHATLPRLIPLSPDAPRYGRPPCAPADGLDVAGQALLSRLRAAARRARSGRQLTLAEALLGLGPGQGLPPEDAVVRTLGEVLGRRPKFHAPGSAMVSFDESWLLRCHAAQRSRDADSLALLTKRRVPGGLRRPFLDLLRAL